MAGAPSKAAPEAAAPASKSSRRLKESARVFIREKILDKREHRQITT
jgi:hypothetical protein